MTIELKPYDRKVTDAIFSELFCKGQDREDGLKEIPADSLQLLASGMDYVLWDLTGEDRLTVKKAIGIIKWLRDQQQMREYKRRNEP